MHMDPTLFMYDLPIFSTSTINILFRVYKILIHGTRFFSVLFFFFTGWKSVILCFGIDQSTGTIDVGRL